MFTSLYLQVLNFFVYLKQLLTCCEMRIFADCQPYNPDIWTNLIISFNSFFTIIEIINILLIINILFSGTTNKSTKYIVKSLLGLVFMGLFFFPFESATLIAFAHLIKKINMFAVYIFINQMSPMVGRILLIASVVSLIAGVIGA